MTSKTFNGGDMNDPNRYSPFGVPGVDDLVTLATNAGGDLQTDLSFDSLTNNDGTIDIFNGGSLELLSYIDHASTSVESGAKLTIKSNYTTANFLISGAGSQLILDNATLTVGGTSNLGTPGLAVTNLATETWGNVALTSPSPLQVSTSAQVEVTNQLSFQGGGTLKVFDGGKVTLDQSITTIANGQIIVGKTGALGASLAPSLVTTTTHDLTISSQSAISVLKNGTLEVAKLTNSGSINVQGGTLNVHGNFSSTTDGTNSVGVSSGTLSVDGNVDVLGLHAFLTVDGGSKAIIKGDLTIGGGGHSGTVKVSNTGSQLTANNTSLTDHSSLEAADKSEIALVGAVTLADSSIIAGSGGGITISEGGTQGLVGVHPDKILVATEGVPTAPTVTASKTTTIKAKEIQNDAIIKDTSSFGDSSNHLTIDGLVLARPGAFIIGGQVPFGPEMLLEFTSAVQADGSSRPEIHFDGSGSTLQLDAPFGFGGFISGWSLGDTIALGGLAGFTNFHAELVGGVHSDGHVVDASGLKVTFNFPTGQSGEGLLLVQGRFTDRVPLADAPDANGFVKIHLALGSTITNNVVVGDAGDNTIDCTPQNDLIQGFAGNDKIFAKAGADILDGGDGDDTLVGNGGGTDTFTTIVDSFHGGNGNDTLYVKADDIIDGGAGRDFVYVVNSNPIHIDLGATSIEWIFSDFGDDVIDGSTQTVGIEVYSDGGNDTITGSAFDDIIWSGSGNDTVTGGDGNDVIVGDIGADSISAGNGNDSLYVDASDTFIDGGAGFDAAYITSGPGMTIDMAATHLEWVADFTGGNDTIDGSGTSINLEVYAAGGTDTVIGGSGADFLWGGSSNDTVTGNSGNDTLVGETGADRLTGGLGIDALYGNSGNGGDGAIDTFVFTDNWGTDFVFDFEHGIDKLDMTGVAGVHSIADLTITSVDGHSHIAFGANLISVANMAGQITAGDFLFA